MNLDDDDIPLGMDPVGPDDTALHSDRNHLPTGERPKRFLLATPLGKTIARSTGVFVPPPGKSITTPPTAGALAVRTTPSVLTGEPSRLSVSAGGSAVPGGVAATTSVATDGGPVTVRVSGPQGNQQVAVARAL